MVAAVGEATPPPDLPPSRVSVSSPSPYSRRRCALTSRIREPAAPRRHAWVSLQGRLVGAEEASSAASAAPGLPHDEAVAWELFSPLHRVLLVATVAAASSRSHAARRIEQLQRSINLRDEVLEDMQQKLDDLLVEMNSLQQHYVKCDSYISTERGKYEIVGSKNIGDEEGSRCVRARPDAAPTPQKAKDLCGTDDARSDVIDRSSLSFVDHEERRMSDLSDLCWSVVSSVDNQINGDNQLSFLAADQQLYNLQKECEEKDATIKELAAAAHASSAADAKRIVELQDALKRKNKVISKLKKDMAALKQMVVELSRAKRPSSAIGPICTDLPVMSNNVLYDMSNSSPSSSDSESPVAPREYLDECFVDSASVGSNSKGSCEVSVAATSLPSKVSFSHKLRSTSPLKEIRINPKVETNAFGRQKQPTSSNGDFKRIRRQSQQDSRNKATRRWM
ncbi:hypothetical protein PAHAL_2G312900 [Panicum hallii]|uniref:Uncharacterized protein n=1 Tax=Panicum hallii TaxID=206008 RepID=A0A2S3H0Q9_9POAL|nr:uncharacterized protein LOC112882561 [Panicum hallii]PAN13082.1 hypothetical protein PAHAL_2G312900 [Panicum hallii]